MAASLPAACLNCGATLTGAYCARCGQKAARPNLTLGAFLRETTQELTNWDGKVPATLRTLFLRPGRLTIDFLAGRRARWLTPLRVYLICSVALFAGRVLVDELGLRPMREMAGVSLERPDGATGPLTPEERQQISEGLPGRILGVERLERALMDSRQFNRAFESTLPRAMFILLPVFALLTNLAWRRVRPRYPAHLYVALHIHAAIFGAMLILSIIVGFTRSDAIANALGLAFLGYVVWYGLTVFRRVFGDPWPQTILKGVAIAFIYFLCFIVVAMMLLVYAVSQI
jgi:Protein of unknown function (DUF3667)